MIDFTDCALKTADEIAMEIENGIGPDGCKRIRNAFKGSSLENAVREQKMTKRQLKRKRDNEQKIQNKKRK